MNGATPLQPLGDPGAAACADGVCELPQPPLHGPAQPEDGAEPATPAR
jgi:hypothetical protein